MDLELNKIHEGDVLKLLKRLKDNSVNCCVTSPPYWALRNYGVKGQIGMEETPQKYLRVMVKVFKEVYRVLKNDGTLWLNLGDTYYGGKGMNGASMAYLNNERVINRKAFVETAPGEIRPNDRKIKGLKPKDLVGIPWMVAFALRNAGWYLRQDIIWHKTNPMPESVSDRCTKAHEYLFLLTKAPSYYYDAAAIRKPYADKTYTTFGCEVKGNGDGSNLIQSENWSNRLIVRKPKAWKTPDGWDTGAGAHGSFHREGREKGRKPREGVDTRGGNQGLGDIPIIEGANKRSVWPVATQSFKEAHFATFPEDLIVDCIKAGCPEGGVVLDPFMGAGTTALVASKLNRNFIGFELNPDYIKIANKRLRKDLGLFFLT